MSRPQVLEDINQNALDIEVLESIVSSIHRYNKMEVNAITGSEQTITVDPIPKTGWSGGITSYTSGEYKISVDSAANSNVGYYAVDENTSNRWSTSNGNTHWFKIELPAKLLVTKMRVNLSSSFTYDVSIQGSNDDSSWDTLYTNSLSISTGITLNQEVSLSTSKEYKFYRVYFALSSSGTSDIYKFELSEYKIQSYNLAYTLSGVPTSWDNNDILLIETPSTSTLGVISNTLNTIPVDMILSPSTKYELVYNSSRFYAREVI